MATTTAKDAPYHVVNALLMTDTRSWNAHWRFWRIQIGWRVYLHTYRPDDRRWVFQPYLIIDT